MKRALKRGKQRERNTSKYFILFKNNTRKGYFCPKATLKTKLEHFSYSQKSYAWTLQGKPDFENHEMCNEVRKCASTTFWHFGTSRTTLGPIIHKLACYSK